MTIVPNIDTSLLKGTPNLLVDIKYIDDTFISEVGRSLLWAIFADSQTRPDLHHGIAALCRR